MSQMENGNGHHKNFAFGKFNLETELQTLRRDGAEVHLAKRPFDVLLFLIENRERVISRDELLEKFWDGHDVYDDALRKCVGVIRHALDDNGKSPRFIETRRGINNAAIIGKSNDKHCDQRNTQTNDLLAPIIHFRLCIVNLPHAETDYRHR